MSSTPIRRRREQLIDVFERVGGPVLAVERVPRETISELRVHRADGTPPIWATASIR